MFDESALIRNGKLATNGMQGGGEGNKGWMGMCPFEGEIGGGVIARCFASLSETTEKIMCIYMYI